MGSQESDHVFMCCRRVRNSQLLVVVRGYLPNRMDDPFDDPFADDLFADPPANSSPLHGVSGAACSVELEEPEPTLWDSFADGLEERLPEATAPAASFVPLAAPAAESAVSAAPAKSGRGRGRRRGTTAVEMERRRLFQHVSARASHEVADLAPEQGEEQPEATPRVRRARAAAAARWETVRRRRGDATAASHARSLPGESAGESAGGEQPIVPYDPSVGERTLALSTQELGGQLEIFKPIAEPVNAQLEQHLVCNFCHTMSQRAAAKLCGKSARTMKRRLRLIAFVLVISRRHFNGEFAHRWHTYIGMVYAAEAAPLYWGTKYKYDGMSAKISLRQRETGASSAKISELMQVSVHHVALYRIVGKYVQFHLNSSTTLRAIECNKAGCIKNSVKRQLHTPATAMLFPRRARLPVCDAHGSNIKSDLSLLLDDVGGVEGVEAEMDKTNCKVHAGHKVAELVAGASPDESRGLMYTSLAFSFAGKERCFKTNLKKYIRRVIKNRPFGAEGAGEAARQHRELVLKQYASSDDSRTSGNRAGRRLKFLLATRSLLNGRWTIEGVIEHYCDDCHATDEELFEDLDDWVDTLDLPGDDCKSRWIGAELPADSVGLMMSIHNFFKPVLIETYEDLQSRPADPQDPDDPMPALVDGGVPDPLDPRGDGSGIGDDEGGGVDHSAAAVDEELGLPVPQKDATQEERQSTYRGNSIKWANGDPQAKLWAYRNALRVQQDMQTFMVRNSANAFRKRELKRRAEGKAPQYIPLLAADGFCTEKAMKGYHDLVMKPDRWKAMPSAYATHEVALSASRMSLAGGAATFQLLEKPFSQFAHFAIVHRGTARQTVAAAALVHTYRTKPCTLRPWFWRHVRAGGGTIEGLLEPDNVAIMECHLDFMEIENVATEALNATIRRFIARCVQHRVQPYPCKFKVACPLAYCGTDSLCFMVSRIFKSKQHSDICIEF